MRSPLSLASATLLLGLAACATPPPEAFTALGGTGAPVQTRPLGPNALGESCFVQPATAPRLDAAVAGAQEVFCGGWTQPSARVYALRERLPAAQVATSGAWRGWLEERFACEAPQATSIAGGASALLMACRRRSSGAQHVAMVIEGPQGTVLADGIPAAVPPIEELATGVARTGEQVVRSAALQIAVSRLGADRTGAADEARFDRLMQLGRELNQTENFAGAEEAYRIALETRVAIAGNDDDPSLALPMMHVALNLSNQGRFLEAERLFGRAEVLARGSADRTTGARLAQYRGMDALNRNALDEASPLFAQAEQGYRAILPRDLSALAQPQGLMLADALAPQAMSALVGLSETLRYQGVVASRRGDDATARARLEQSATTLQLANLGPATLEGRLQRSAAVTVARTGRALPAALQLGVAEQRLSVALAGERPVATTLFLAGREQMAAGQPQEAVAAFREGAAVLRERRLGIDTALVIPYLEALEALARANPRQAPALRAEAFSATQLAQRSETARFLAQASARLAAADGNEAVAAAVRRREDAELALRSLLLERDAALAAGRAADALDRRIAEQRAVREEAEAEALAAAPAFRLLRDEAISVEQAMAALGPNEGMVQFLLGPEHSFGVLLRGGGAPATLARLDITEAEAVRLIAAARSAVDAIPGPGGALPAFDVAAAAALHDRLLRPFEAALEGVQTLVVVPDGPLLGLPFGMLLTGPADPANLSPAPWLIRRHAVVHAPSVQALVRVREGSAASSAPRPYIGFGDFVPPSEAQLRASFPADRCGRDAAVARALGRLPGTAGEVAIAAQIMGAQGSQVLGPRFTAQSVTGAGLDAYRIVHFATHGLLPGDLSCLTEPSVMVSNPAGARNAAGTFLPASAIMTLSMDADLVILSACNTAGPGTPEGAQQAAEALSGLARAFFVAGARGLLATHWLASDAAAQFIVPVMLSLQSSGLPSATALQQAQLALLTDEPGRPSLAHPFFWAPFALIGDGRRAAPVTTAAVPSAGG